MKTGPVTGSSSFPIPPGFGDKAVLTFGASAEAWLRGLPALLEECVERWRLDSCEAAPGLSVNYVGFAHSPEYGPVVLKTGPAHLELYTGMDALRVYGGRRACRLYDADEERGVLLMERVLPGDRLKDEPNGALRLEVGVDFASRLPVAAPQPFPTFEVQMRRAFARTRREGRAGPEFLSRLAKAEKLYERLRSLARPRLLLHGDLHHENILRDARDGWKVIDPQGRLGDNYLECARFLLCEWERFRGLDDPARLSGTMSAFAAVLGEDLETIAAACYLDGTVSACWSLEDGRGSEVIEGAVKLLRSLEAFL